MNEERSRIFLVDDEELAGVGIRHHLEDRFDIVGEADNVADAVVLIREREPDLVLLDIGIAGGSGLDVVERVRLTQPDMRFLVLTTLASRGDVIRLFSADVDGCFTRQAVGVDFADIVDETLEGGRPIARQLAEFLLNIDDDIDEGISSLTLRERQVFVLITRGYTYGDAAEKLGMSNKVLRNHLANISAKVGPRDQGPSEGGSAGVREPRNPYGPIDSAAAAVDPDHEATGPPGK